MAARESISCPCCQKNDLKTAGKRIDKFFIDPRPFDIVLCESCEVSFVSPRPREGHLINFYPDTYAFQEEAPSESFFSRFLKKLETFYRAQGLNHDVCRLLKVTKLREGKCLEIGCGTGDRLIQLQQKRFQVLGVEPAAAACLYGKERYGLSIVEKKVEDWPGPDKPLDIILIFNVLEHLPHPVEELKRIAGWLKPGGMLALQIPNAKCWQARWFGTRWAAMDAPRDLYYFSPSALGKAFEQAGLEIFKIEYGHHWMHPPTMVSSLFPSLDPALLWSQESRSSTAFKKIAWGLATLTAIPWGMIEKIFQASPIMTLYARRGEL